MFGCLRRRRRRRALAGPFPGEWEAIIDARLPWFARLSPEHQVRFRDELRVLLDRVRFYGAHGFGITDEVRVVIGASAVRLILALDARLYDRLKEVVVYPFDFVRPDDGEDSGGHMLGEAHHFGTVVLSWPAVLHGLAHPGDGHDVAVHEFAHVLDKTSLGFDGTPRLRHKADYDEWREVMSRHFRALQRGARRQREVLDDYGAEDEAEFFAVATETFFECPDALREQLPDLYGVLRRFYGYDP